MTNLPKRLLSIDVFRAITMFLMIFVNDVAGVDNVPSWIGHTQADEDGMGFADIIFPTFLFIVGLSMPWALRKRIQKGDSFISILYHIFSRSFALIVMGFYHVNMESYSDESMLPKAIWGLLITLSFFLVWLDYPLAINKILKYALISLGAAALITMALLYKGGEGGQTHGMEPSWWGILGIIGWAYLVSAVVFTVIRANIYLHLSATMLFLAINITSHLQLMPFDIPVVGDASSITLIMLGALVSLMYSILTERNREEALWSLLAGTAVALTALGFFIRPYAGGISKIMATPAWVTICSGIAILFFAGMIWLIDIKKKQDWFSWISAAGTSTLTCYLMPYILYFIFDLAGFWYPAVLNSGLPGILRSLSISFLLIVLVKKMEKKKLRLKI